MREPIARYRDTATMAGFLVLLVAFIGTVLVPCYRLANDLSANSAALKVVSEQQGQPEVMMRLLAALRDQLRAGGYIGQSLKDIGATVRHYDAALTKLGASEVLQSQDLTQVQQLWAAYHAQLAPVAGRRRPIGLAEQHADRHLVEVGQRLQPGQAQVAEAPLVGADRRRAPPSSGPLLDVGQRQGLGLADGPQAMAHAQGEGLLVVRTATSGAAPRQDGGGCWGTGRVDLTARHPDSLPHRVAHRRRIVTTRGDAHPACPVRDDQGHYRRPP